MRLFGSPKGNSGWFCINVHDDRVDVCHVRAGARARPEVLICDSYRKEGGDGATLARLRRELALDRHRCLTLLKAGEYQLLPVEKPNVPPAEAKSAARWRIGELIDYPIESAVFDAAFIPAPDGTLGKASHMLAVTAKQQTIAATVRPFNEADIALEVVDVPDFAQRNLARRLEQEGRALALLVIGDRNALLTFTCAGELYQARRIDVSAQSFAGATPEQRRALYERLTLELQRSLDHFDRQFRHLSVSRVMVTPVPGADDLREALAGGLDVPVALVHLAEMMDFPRIPELHDEARQAQCLQLIGAALREPDPAPAR